jgi:hypothetical protein
MIMQ